MTPHTSSKLRLASDTPAHSSTYETISVFSCCQRTGRDGHYVLCRLVGDRTSRPGRRAQSIRSMRTSVRPGRSYRPRLSCRIRGLRDRKPNAKTIVLTPLIDSFFNCFQVSERKIPKNQSTGLLFPGIHSVKVKRPIG